MSPIRMLWKTYRHNSNIISNQENIISPRNGVLKAETEFRREFTIILRGNSAFYLSRGAEILIGLPLNHLSMSKQFFHPPVFMFNSMYKYLNWDVNMWMRHFSENNQWFTDYIQWNWFLRIDNIPNLSIILNTIVVSCCSWNWKMIDELPRNNQISNFGIKFQYWFNFAWFCHCWKKIITLNT
jgi:hypothetical protein